MSAYTYFPVRYAGDLKEGVRHGKGILKLRGGGEYDGQWMNGRMQGFGVYLWPDARIYKGSWEAGLRDGEGTIVFPSGERSELARKPSTDRKPAGIGEGFHLGSVE